MIQGIPQILLRTACLFAFWMLLSGKTETLYLIIGLSCSALIAILSFKPHKAKPLSLRTLRLPIQGAIYLIWLMKSIFLAAVHVTKIIWSPSLPITPKLIQHKTKLKDSTDQVIFANSITLTPGTITVDLGDDELLVHELDHVSSEDIRTGAMEDRIKRARS